MRVWVLGSGTLIPDERRGPPGYWIETPGAFVLMDCGSGTLRSMARFGLNWRKVSHLLITHFHTDHVGEVAPLMFALRHGLASPREAPLTLVGPRGFRDHLSALAEAHGPHVLDPGFELRVCELSPGDAWAEPAGVFSLRTVATRHAPNSLGYRVEAEGTSLGFTGDTGPEPRLGPFFRGCRLLIAECSFPKGRAMDTHLTPPELAAMASAAAPELLVTVHCYPPLDPVEVPGELAGSGYHGRVLAGFDGLGLDLSGEEVRVVNTPQE